MIIKRLSWKATVGAVKVPFPILGCQISVGAKLAPRMNLIVDSGASATLLPWWVAQVLGIDSALSSAPQFTFAGLGGGQGARLAHVDIDAGGIILPAAPVYFLPNARTIAGHDGLLGQLGFFDKVKLVQIHDRVPPYFYLVK